jgi:hypothetical protein
MQTDFNQPELSIIVPVGNYSFEQHPLHKWICDLDYELCELIIVHDSVSPSSIESLRSQLGMINTSRLTLVEVGCNSPGLARNFGMDIAVGKFITFWDADDVPVLKNVMEILTQSINSIDLIIGGFLRVSTDSGRVVSSHHLVEGSLPIQIATDPGIWRMIFKSNIVQDLRFKNYLMAEDIEFLCRVLSKEIKISTSDKILYRYSIGCPKSLTASKSKMNDVPRALIEIFKLCKVQNFTNVYTRALFIKLSMTYLKNAQSKKSVRILWKMRKIPISKIPILIIIAIQIVVKQKARVRRIDD